MVVARVGLLAVAILLSAAGMQTVQAQAQAPATTYWLHIDGGPAYWVNAQQEDPAGTGATGGYNALGFVLGEPGVAEWDIPFTPALAGPVALSPGGQMVSTIYIGGNSAAGRVTVTSELRLGTTVIATATAAAATVYSAGYQKVELTTALTATSLDPSVGDPHWVIQAEGAGAQIFLSATTDRWTQFTLPIVLGATVPSVQHHNLTGPAASFSLEPTSPANATHVYHWATNLTSLSLTLTGNRVAGNVTYEVRDGANKTVHQGAFTGNATAAMLTGAAGNWTVQVALSGFAGNLTGLLGEPQASTSSSSSASGTNAPAAGGSASSSKTGSGSGGNATGAGTSDKQGAPGLSLPLMLGSLGLVALVRRRR